MSASVLILGSCASQETYGTRVVDAAPGASVTATPEADVASLAGERMCVILGVRYDALDEWQRAAAASVTGSAATNLASTLPALRDQLTSSGQVDGQVTCRVILAQVRSQSADSARVGLSIATVEPSGVQQRSSATTNYDVTMQKVDDQWLVSEIQVL